MSSNKTVSVMQTTDWVDFYITADGTLWTVEERLSGECSCPSIFRKSKWFVSHSPVINIIIKVTKEEIEKKYGSFVGLDIRDGSVIVYTDKYVIAYCSMDCDIPIAVERNPEWVNIKGKVYEMNTNDLTAGDVK